MMNFTAVESLMIDWLIDDWFLLLFDYCVCCDMWMLVEYNIWNKLRGSFFLKIVYGYRYVALDSSVCEFFESTNI